MLLELLLSLSFLLHQKFEKLQVIIQERKHITTDLHEGGSPMSSEIARLVMNSMQKNGKKTKTVELLTKRESEILDFLAKGYLYKEIATELFISKETVKKHIHNIYDKLHVQNRTEALNKAFCS